MASSYETIPANLENEAQLLVSAIKDEEVRKKFIKQVSYHDFRTREFLVLAWAVHELVQNNMVVTPEAVYIKSKSSPMRKFRFEKIDYDEILKNTALCPVENFDDFARQLKIDKVKAEGLDKTFDSLYPAFLDPKVDLNQMLLFYPKKN